MEPHHHHEHSHRLTSLNKAFIIGGVSVERQRADKAQRQQEKGTRGHERSP